jgi:hypothetical protein
MRLALDPAGHRVPRTKPTCLLHTWRPHRRRPFALVLHLHQHQSSRNLHLQYLAKNQSTERCQSLITQGSDHPMVLEPHMVLRVRWAPGETPGWASRRTRRGTPGRSQEGEAIRRSPSQCILIYTDLFTEYSDLKLYFLIIFSFVLTNVLHQPVEIWELNLSPLLSSSRPRTVLHARTNALLPC